LITRLQGLPAAVGRKQAPGLTPRRDVDLSAHLLQVLIVVADAVVKAATQRRAEGEDRLAATDAVIKRSGSDGSPFEAGIPRARKA